MSVFHQRIDLFLKLVVGMMQQMGGGMGGLGGLGGLGGMPNMSDMFKMMGGMGRGR